MSSRLRSANRADRASCYSALKDPHLEEFYARRADVRSSLAELGLVTSARVVVHNTEHTMRLVDRALAVLECEDAASIREAVIANRGDRMSRLVEGRDQQAQAKRQHALGQYAKERLRRAEKKEQQVRYSSATSTAHLDV